MEQHSAVDNRHRLGDAPDLFQVMVDPQDSDATAVQLGHQRLHQPHARFVDAGGWFVEDQQPGRRADRLGQQHALALATGQAAKGFGAHSGHAGTRQGLGIGRLGGSVGAQEGWPALTEKGHEIVDRHRQVAVEVRQLRDIAHGGGDLALEADRSRMRHLAQQCAHQ